jgi:hypothetical protein
MNIRLHGAAGLLCAAALTPGVAPAYELLTENGLCPGGIRWTSDQTVTINIANVGSQSFELTDAVMDLTDRVNSVGGTWFDYTLPFSVGTNPYEMLTEGSPDGDGINEIGLADLSAFGSLGMGPTDVDATDCTINEGDVFLDSASTAWDFGTPPDGTPDTCTTEDCYFDVERKRCEDGGKFEDCPNGPYVYWARMAMLHEMGHTLGLAHSDSSYSFMNYNVRPFTNRAEEKRIEPLPDDREALRDQYPGTAEEIDAAVAVTWYDVDDVSDGGASDAKQLCRPSTGTAYSPDIFDPYCGVDSNGDSGSIEVCPNDYLYVRYAIANYGTEALTVTEELWFSKNVTLDTAGGADKQSSTVPAAKLLSPQSSYRQGRKYRVPTTVRYDTDYYPIMFIDSGSDYASEESQQNNWIPLRIKLHVKPANEC